MIKRLEKGIKEKYTNKIGEIKNPIKMAPNGLGRNKNNKINTTHLLLLGFKNSPQTIQYYVVLIIHIFSFQIDDFPLTAH